MIEIAKLEQEYLELLPAAQQFADALAAQLDAMMARDGVPLASPIERRVKSWASVDDKLRRKQRDIETVLEVEDLIGLRIVILFLADQDKACELVRTCLTVLQDEDTSHRLSDNQFGYQSRHFLVKIPTSGRHPPALSRLPDLRVELQVRTLAQHVWATASHILQYKREDSVPQPLRRTINRIAALLETVDLELERVRSQRQSYLGGHSLKDDTILSVDDLTMVLDETWPLENRLPAEPYDDLLIELAHLGIRTAGELRGLLSTWKSKALETNRQWAQVKLREYDHTSGRERSRQELECGIFLNHIGLTRTVLDMQYPEDRRYAARNQAALRRRLAESAD